MESTPHTSNSPTELEHVLDPELMDFCSCHHIEPAIRDFNDDKDDSDPELPVSDQSSEIEEESALKKFTQAFQTAQIIALKKSNKNKQGVYSKRSTDTMKWHKQVHLKLVSKGFLPVDEYIKLKKIPVKGDKLTPESDIGNKAVILE